MNYEVLTNSFKTIKNNRMKKILFILFTFNFSLSTLFAQTGTWTAPTNLPINSNNGVCLLMTDGTVICKNQAGPGNGTGWDRLTPDAHGSYINGTWDTIRSMFEDRLFFSTQVLPDGRVYVAGGEYGAGTNAGEVYDPVSNTWTMCGAIPGGWKIYDGNSEILYDGTVLEGPQIGSATSYNILIWSPVTLNYTVEPNSIYDHDEAEWLKLRDSSVLFVGIAGTNANRYIPQTATWVTDASTPGDLYDQYGEEAGCALMLPNGKSIFFGATPYNCIYTPSGNSSPGSWTSADSFPKIQGTYMGQPDASGAMMVNGHILLACSPIGTGSNEFNSPAYFVEYDYVTNSFKQVMATIPGQGGDSISYIACYQTQMLDLPDGNVLVSVSQTGGLTNQYYFYTPGSGPIPQGKPVINSITPLSCTNYQITGKLFNGISEGAAYGDDWQMSTNWPLVRLTSAGGNVWYAKTSNWNRIGAVYTDSLEDTANFQLPSIPGGTYSLVVVVNGFASSPTLFSTFGTTISAQQNVSCLGGNNGSATVLASNGVTPYTYLWSPSGGTNATASNLSAGTYTITVTPNGGGCSASVAVTITQPATVLTLTTTVVNNTGTTLCNGQATAMPGGGEAPYTYSWSPGGATTQTLTGACEGMYCCTITDAAGCSKSTCVVINSTDGVGNINSNSGPITVYPNPSNGIFTVAFSHLELVSGSQTIEVYNVLGEQVYDGMLKQVQHDYQIDMSKQPNGVYFYRVLEEDGTLLGEGKVMIEK